MCGRFTLKNVERLLDRLRARGVDVDGISDLVPHYNVAPSQEILTVVQQAARREATFLQWGLIPSWSKEPKGFINARVETIDEKPSFRSEERRVGKEGGSRLEGSG